MKIVKVFTVIAALLIISLLFVNQTGISQDQNNQTRKGEEKKIADVVLNTMNKMIAKNAHLIKNTNEMEDQYSYELLKVN